MDINTKKLKCFKYINERNEITKKLLNILQITNNNKTFDTYSLDNNKEIQQKIIDLIPDIEKVFVISKWSYFQKNKNKKEKPYVSLSKSLLKDMNIKLISYSKSLKINDKFHVITFYDLVSDIDTFLN